MKKKLAIVFGIVILVLVLALGCAALYFTRPIDAFNIKIRANTAELKFDGESIPSFEELKAKIGEFPFAKSADLGSYKIFPEQEEELRTAYPDVKFYYRLYRKILGMTLPADTAELDLSAVELNGIDELKAHLGEFDKMEKVVFGENILKSNERDELVNMFPNIDFSAVVIYEIYGKTIREDSETIDLTGITPDSLLIDKLAVFKNAKYIDLHDVELSNEEKLALAERYSDVSFGMVAEIAGLSLDNSVDFIDLNKKKIPDLEAFERALKLFPNVKKIEMCDCGISNEDMASLGERNPNIKFVWRVHLGQWSLRTDAVSFSVLIVNYEHKRLTSKDIEVLKYCPDLEALDLGHQALTDISCIPKYMPKLKVLILADNRISDLTPLAQLKHLHYLEFFVNTVTDLTPLAQCKELVDLNISYNYRINDITPLLDLPLLERLWLEHVSVSAKDVQLLRDTYPNAKIVNVGTGSVDQGWRSHKRYWAMLDMYHKRDYISELFTQYDGRVFPD